MFKEIQLYMYCDWPDQAHYTTFLNIQRNVHAVIGHFKFIESCMCSLRHQYSVCK